MCSAYTVCGIVEPWRVILAGCLIDVVERWILWMQPIVRPQPTFRNDGDGSPSGGLSYYRKVHRASTQSMFGDCCAVGGMLCRTPPLWLHDQSISCNVCIAFWLTWCPCFLACRANMYRIALGAGLAPGVAPAFRHAAPGPPAGGRAHHPEH